MCGPAARRPRRLTEVAGFLPLPEDDHMFTGGHRQNRRAAAFCDVAQIEASWEPRVVSVEDVGTKM